MDISTKAINYARQKYGNKAIFSIQGITDLREYSNGLFDIVVCNEVLEHIMEYRMERQGLNELKRITRKGGLVILGTPNSEMLADHGFSFDEIQNLFRTTFSTYYIFENALIPSDKRKALWEKRLAGGKVGMVVSENINLSETVLDGINYPRIKEGLMAGTLSFSGHDINTRLLHNTHSWVVVAEGEGP